MNEQSHDGHETVSLSGALIQSSDSTANLCAICFDTMNTNSGSANDTCCQNIKVLNCQHQFHTQCINQWCSSRYDDYSDINHIPCPLCKRDIARESLPEQLQHLFPNTSTILLKLCNIPWMTKISKILFSVLCSICIASMMVNFARLDHKDNSTSDGSSSSNGTNGDAGNDNKAEEANRKRHIMDQANNRMIIAFTLLCFMYMISILVKKYMERATNVPIPKVTDKMEKIAITILMTAMFTIVENGFVWGLTTAKKLDTTSVTFQILMYSQLINVIFCSVIIIEMFQRYSVSVICTAMFAYFFICNVEKYQRYILVDHWHVNINNGNNNDQVIRRNLEIEIGSAQRDVQHQV